MRSCCCLIPLEASCGCVKCCACGYSCGAQCHGIPIRVAGLYSKGNAVSRKGFIACLDIQARRLVRGDRVGVKGILRNGNDNGLCRYCNRGAGFPDLLCSRGGAVCHDHPVRSAGQGGGGIAGGVVDEDSYPVPFTCHIIGLIEADQAVLILADPG